ncbi:hypothetical protein M8J76_001688 [Diaphorina citri]|nr:hypothetical protein M8J76_001688 [Diaphorina citri]
MKIAAVLMFFAAVCRPMAAEEETNPFLEAANSLLQESLRGGKSEGEDNGLGAMASGVFGVVQTLMASQGGGKSGGGGGGAELLGTLASALLNQGGGGGGNAGGSGFDPQVIGQIVSLFSSAQNSGQQSSQGRKNSGGGEWDGLLDLATNFISGAADGQNSGGSSGGSPGADALLNLLPIMMNSLSGGHNHNEDPRLDNAQEHAQHDKTSSFLPPFLSTLYEYFLMAKKSEFGRSLYESSGLSTILETFTDPKTGQFKVDAIFNSLQNARFRKRWIQSCTSFVAQIMKHLAEPNTQLRYLSTAQMLGNNVLQSQGYPKSALLDSNRPTESTINVVNAVLKRQFGMKVDSAHYIRPAVQYLKDVFKIVQDKGLILSNLSEKDIELKLSEVLNTEVLEPVLRLYRVYQFTKKNKNCDRQLLCILNNKQEAGLKPTATRLSSLVGAWFMSGYTGTPYWKLYNAATETQAHNCLTKYPADCSQFHEEDTIATTDYYYEHNEL